MHCTDQVFVQGGDYTVCYCNTTLLGCGGEGPGASTDLMWSYHLGQERECVVVSSGQDHGSGCHLRAVLQVCTQCTYNIYRYQSVVTDHLGTILEEESVLSQVFLHPGHLQE